MDSNKMNEERRNEILQLKIDRLEMRHELAECECTEDVPCSYRKRMAKLWNDLEPQEAE